MKVTRFILTFLFTLFYSFELHAQWIQVADFGGTERDDIVTFTCQERAFAGSGMEVGYQVTKDFYEYKADLNQWVAIANLPGEARQHCFNFSFQNYACVYAGLNQAGNDLKDGFLYNPVNNTWQLVSPYPGSGSSSCAATTIGNKGYAGLGRSNQSIVHNDWWQYNSDSNIWVQKANFPGMARTLAACFECNGFIYVAGGIDANEFGLGDVWQYNPQNDSWLAISSLLIQPVGSAASCKVKQVAAIVGGYDGQTVYTSHAMLFDGFNITWNNLPAIPVNGARKGSKAFSVNGELYVTCGITSDNTRLKSTWKYDQINSFESYSKSGHVFNLYPNPASESFEISVSQEYNSLIKNYTISTLTGQNIKSGKIPEGSNSETIFTTEIHPGFYWITFSISSETFIQKLLISNQ